MSPAPSIILHQWLISPFCAKVRKALVAKDLAFDTVEYNGLRALEAKRLSAAGKLPVLDYTPAEGETRRVQDSTRIIELLEREHPAPSLWPEQPRDRHLAHLIEDWADEALFWLEAWFRLMDPAASRKAGEHLAAGRPGWERVIIQKAGELTYKRKLDALGLTKLDESELVAMVRGHLDAVEGLLEGREWLVGERQSIADIAVAAQLGEFVRTSRFADEIRGRAQLWEWLERNPG
jgi:glutathione S-transferase